jgi:hypothetical protein
MTIDDFIVYIIIRTTKILSVLLAHNVKILSKLIKDPKNMTIPEIPSCMAPDIAVPGPDTAGRLASIPAEPLT